MFGDGDSEYTNSMVGLVAERVKERLLNPVPIKPLKEEELKMCYTCGTENAVNKCANCKLARYCNLECQKKIGQNINQHAF